MASVTQKSKPQVVCQHFLEGKCKFGTKCAKSHPASKGKRQSDAPLQVKDQLMKMLANHKTVLEKKAALMSERDAYNRKYVIIPDSKDTKSVDPFSDRLKFFDDQLKASRDMMRSYWGTKVFKIQIPVGLVFNASGAGTVASVQSIDPSPEAEWISLSSIFDEYKVVEFAYDFVAISAKNSAAGLMPMGVIAFDPTDGSTPTSVTGLSQLQQHLLVPHSVEDGSGARQWYLTPHRNLFRVKIPDGVLEDDLAVRAISAGQWQSTDAGAYYPYGRLKLYSASVPASVAAYGGMLYYHCEFRIRT